MRNDELRNDEVAHCDCGNPVPEGADCSICGMHMPSGDEIADLAISKMERELQNLLDADMRDD